MHITLEAPTPAQMEAFAAELAGNGTMGFNETMDAIGKMGEKQNASAQTKEGWVPTLSVPGGLTNVTGGVDNTL